MAAAGQKRPEANPGSGNPAGGPPANELLQRGDADGDGKLTRDEMPEDRREIFDRMVQEVDANGDKALSLEEFTKGLAMVRGGGAPQGAYRGSGSNNTAGGEDGVFAAMDTNGDGKLSREELYAATESLKKLDRDGDGTVTKREAGMGKTQASGARPGAPGGSTAGGPQAAEGMAKMMLERLKQADTNGDKKISKDEAPERMKENFDRIDRNGDGFIDEAEAKEMISMMAKGGAPGTPAAPTTARGGEGLAAYMLKQNDKNGDGKMSRDEAPDRMRENFARNDKNGDGFIDESELKEIGAMLQKAGGRPGAPAAGGGEGRGSYMLKQADKNGDGKLGKDEAPERMREHFDRIDKNGDGSLDAEELRGTMQNRPKQ